MSSDAAGAVSSRPLFVLSLPRSGSTLVQRVLASHDAIATTPEPWVLLPLLYATRAEGHWAEYDAREAAKAVADFGTRLGAECTFDEEAARFARTLYASAGGGSTYFVDKTPRYFFVADELFRLFPDAKFVFLWRNPLAIVASIVETWLRGRWSLGRALDDLERGPERLVSAWEANRDLAIAVRYEDLVCEGDREWRRLFEYLELDFDPAVLTSFVSTRIEGPVGDTAGYARYDQLSAGPLDKWRSTLGSPVRKAWCRSYLQHIGARRLASMGYRLEELLDALDETPQALATVPSDVARTAYTRLMRTRRARAARLLESRRNW